MYHYKLLFVHTDSMDKQELPVHLFICQCYHILLNHHGDLCIQKPHVLLSIAKYSGSGYYGSPAEEAAVFLRK